MFAKNKEMKKGKQVELNSDRTLMDSWCGEGKRMEKK
jgi:hypothetical protein